MEVNRIYNESNLETMKRMPDNFLDSIVTDPPYGISFMGKKWDYSIPDVATFTECLRVLKPGGYLLCFCGTRTQHRMAVNIEDAGFELRDIIAWVYGCLSEDTEILTINGWERYNKNIAFNPVLCYLCNENKFEFHVPTKSYHYENKHTAYRIQSDNTDQIVSRNHRVIVERSGRKEFAYAETLEQQENIPFLESLSDLPETIYYPEQGTSITKQDLLHTVQKQITSEKQNFANYPNRTTTKDINNLPCVPQTSVETECVVKENKKSNLLKSVQRETEGHKFDSKQIRQNRFEISRNWITGGIKSCMEGRCDLFQKTWELFTYKIREVSDRIYGHGSKRRICNGTPIDNGKINKQNAFKNRGCSSLKSQPAGQQDRESNVVSNQSSTQTTRITRATITPIEYKGNVWCVEVPTGAFVARRNGKIFITGNSGFPKSLSISKALDKQNGTSLGWFIDYILNIADEKGISRKELTMLFPSKNGNPTGWLWNKQKTQGITTEQYNTIKNFLELPFENIQQAEREVIGTGCAGLTGGTISNFAGEKEFDITAPATDAAKQWDGWGTALKPAMELITIARKPLSEKTVAENVLKWGTGGINIDGCRVETNPEVDDMLRTVERKEREAPLWKDGSGFKNENNKLTGVPSSGRFPANLIVSYPENECLCKDNLSKEQKDKLYKWLNENT